MSLGTGPENHDYGSRDVPRWPCDNLHPQKIGTNLANKRRLLGQYSSLMDLGHGGSYMP
jgi:hypothetical protein